MKYLVMIVRRTLPNLNSAAGKEAKLFLRMLTPKGSEGDSASSVCRMLHLAFKQQSTEEIYDTLVYCFVRAARKYDPLHAEKVALVCKEIEGASANQEGFTAQELTDRVGFDCSGILRSLVGKDFLSSVTGKKRKVVGYKKANWPPPPAFFQSGPIGFVYVLQIWFRFYLNEHIIGEMRELESKQGLCQLFGNDGGTCYDGAPISALGRKNKTDLLISRRQLCYQIRSHAFHGGSDSGR